jgi:hypothetical protein
MMKALRIPAALAILNMLLIGGGRAEGYYEANVDVDIVTESRGVLPQYSAAWQHDGLERSYVEARDQERYSLRLRNNTGQRVGVVIAVDGRNIISGKKSHLKSNERMYVLKPWQTAEYEGWRTAKNRVNRFYFTDVDDSYSASWDDYSAMGVIAVAAFEERRPKNQRPNVSRSRGSIASKQMAPMGAEAGTGMGEDTWSPSHQVKFKPRKYPVTEKFIKYEWRSTLCRKGAISCHDDFRDYGNRFWPRDEWDSRDGYAPRRRWVR